MFSSFGIAFFCLGGIFIEALQKYAITLIYPDGEVEKEPITDFKFHISYYRNHMGKFPRFASFLRGINLPDNDSDAIDFRGLITDILGKNGVLIIENINVLDIVYNISFLDEEKCDFLVYFPEYFQSKEQLESYIALRGDYSNELLSFGKYDSNENTHLDISEEETEEFIYLEKEKFDIDELKR